MSEKVLKALLQLFAIIARPERSISDEGAVVESFLKQQLNEDLVQVYLNVYNEFYNLHQKRHSEKSKRRKRFSSSSVRVLKICTEINEELTQKQKNVVLIRLLEYIKSDKGDITDQELDFVEAVASTFHVSTENYHRISDFILNTFETIIPSNRILIIDNNKVLRSAPEIKHIYSSGLEGQIRVLYIKETNMFILRYLGETELYLNSQLLAQDKVRILNVGSSIKSSKITPIYYSDIVTTFHFGKIKSHIVLEAVNLKYNFKGGEPGLHSMNLLEKGGQLIGIMGASGTGKTTLINVLNGSLSPTAGEVLINGINIHKEKKRIEGVIGFVSQDDLLIEELTVFQNLYFNTKLCFSHYSEFRIIRTVFKILQSLGLYEIKHMKVGSPLNKKISGGQRKRLNIALELIREPAILFLDEPTSGLSSRDSENILDLLKELALKGKLVFVVIHQPSSDIFKMFDKLFILDKGGYLIYYGDPVDSIIYFKSRIQQANWNESECHACGNVNPEQLFNIVDAEVIDEYGNQTKTRKVLPKEWFKYFQEFSKKASRRTILVRELPEFSFKVPSKFKQFLVFVKRDILAKLTNKQYLFINLLEAPVLAFLLSYITKYYNVDVKNEIGYYFLKNSNLPVYLFMAVIVALFVGLTVSAQEIYKDRKILKREAFLNLSWSSYLLSKVAIVFALSAIQAFTFVLIGNSIIEIKGMYIEYWLVLFSLWCSGNMMGLNISDGFKTSVTIYIIIPFLIIPQIILSGIIVKFDKLNPSISSPGTIPIYGEIMSARWAYEALAVHQFKSNIYQQERYDTEKQKSIANYKKHYWLKKLENKLNSCESYISKIEKKEIVINNLELIRNEIRKELAISQKPDFNEALLSQLYYEKFNKDIIKSTRNYFAGLSDKYSLLYRNMSNSSNKLAQKHKTSYLLNADILDVLKTNMMVSSKIRKKLELIVNKEFFSEEKYIKEIISIIGKENWALYKKQIAQYTKKKSSSEANASYVVLMKNYSNESLEEFVTNKNDINKIVEYNNNLYQISDPIYLDPTFPLLKAHFYAPQKKIFGIFFDTYWVNIAVIWIITILLYITLYYRIIKRAFDFFEEKFSPRLNKNA